MGLLNRCGFVLAFCFLTHLVFYWTASFPPPSSSASGPSRNATDYFHLATNGAHEYLKEHSFSAVNGMRYIRTVTRTLVVVCCLFLATSASLFDRTKWSILVVYTLVGFASLLSDLTPTDQAIPISFSSSSFHDPVMLPVFSVYSFMASLLVAVQLSCLFVLSELVTDYLRICLYAVVGGGLVFFTSLYLIFIRWLYSSVLLFVVPSVIYLHYKLLK
jgi:hypothetical protein